MCDERRATFQKTEMEENGTTHPVYSMHLSGMQTIVSIAAGLVILIGAAFGSSAWVKTSIVKTATQDFQKAMDTYYEKIIPERNKYYDRLLDARLMAFGIETSKPIEIRLDSLDLRVNTLEGQGENVVKVLDRHEDLLLEILRRLPEGKR